MILRKLNLAPRSALCFGIFCLMIVALGVLALRQAALLNTAEKFIEENVLPSVKLLGSLDREFVGIRGNNARLRNPLEPQDRKTKALSDIQQSRALIAGFSDALGKLIVTPKDVRHSTSSTKPSAIIRLPRIITWLPLPQEISRRQSPSPMAR